jgi:hypothetical protein
MTNLPTRTAQSRENARNKADAHFQAWENRTQLVKQELEAERTASDAKTLRLRALRLAKEAEDREAARIVAANAPAARPRGKRRV